MIADCCFKYHSKAVAKVTERLGCVYHCCQIRDVLWCVDVATKGNQANLQLLWLRLWWSAQMFSNLSQKPWKQEIAKIPDWPRREADAEF